MSSIQGLTEQDIVEHLARDPSFFERHAELLVGVRLGHPHGPHTVSLQERQTELLRDKIKGLERKILDMIRHGQENETHGERLHQWTLSLMAAVNPQALPELVERGLRQHFLIPTTGLRLWGLDAVYAELPQALAVSSDVKSFANSLSQPYCGVNSGFEAAHWLTGEVGSLALVPLVQPGSGKAFGLLVLGSPDATRYTAEMGTEFLERVGALASAALAGLLPRTAPDQGDA
ncbi:DUF484 family protein [Roseateles sp. BYS180W]|uniref:DUF484 family protein n=1 Tax=Roseateles rivi TaxID=3299028 RepID=A0ABW7FR25_9BURK